MQIQNVIPEAIIENDNIFFEDINEWDNFCDNMDDGLDKIK